MLSSLGVVGSAALALSLEAKAQDAPITLTIGGESVQIMNPDAKITELNGALATPEGFKAFKEDPAAFGKTYELTISPDLSAKLQEKLAPIDSLEDANARARGDGDPLWAAAIAEGAFALASSKIAIAIAA